MEIKEAIILAGGLGTRLRSAVPDLPKCMAPVNGKPFLSFIINHLQSQGIKHFIFSLGYRSETVIDFLNKEFPTLLYKTSVEEEPLGTGGAVKKACKMAKDKCTLVVNGDTLYKIDVEMLAGVHCLSGASCSLSLKPMTKFDRYGVVEIDRHCIISSFREKQFYESGLINGGVYALNSHKFLEENLPEKFSFETDYLEKFYKIRRMFGVVQDEYFIDIGIPEDYERAQKELADFE
jgi:D-glycero-alpha-D-manno-heptose 1-phosphate guanylyltransferase